VSDWQEFIFNAFINLEPMQRSEDGCDMRRFRSFNHRTCKTVLNLLEAVVKFRVDNRDSNGILAVLESR